MDFPTGQRQSTNIKCYIYCNAFKLQCDIPHSPDLKNKVFFYYLHAHFRVLGSQTKQQQKTHPKPGTVSQGPITGLDPIFP